MRIIKITILILITATIMFGCNANNESETNNNESIKIYTTLYPIQYAIERIAGDSITVESIYPPGVDAHSYEPTSKDITDIAKSDAFIYLGAGMEAFAETAADALSNQDVKLIELGKHEELFQVEETEEAGHHAEQDEVHDGHHHGDHDPHIWIDPIRMLEMSNLIKQELISLNPEQASLYNDNFTTLEEDLLELDNQYTNTLKDKKNKKILVTHAAYGYWEKRYGLQQIAINGLSSNSEPSQKELTNIVNQANKSKLKYIIFEQNTSNRVSEVIQQEIGAETVVIHNLSVLTDDDIQNHEDYLTLMEKNLTTLNQVTN
ncbi:metal ABC transporter solute-binding protein, Zn/Mn family [Oceanobacillus sp. Castelsardo]|uniref:metal ABC transporter solute-binding protein, Zn/Mn family n=1 Tax=Oceanobacillus sp. Castelsardo TaxID=1851204 RepID=UPI000839639D|nr:zinc ABC transporter substrate-binding protein [Oceanobacillus sp. Castelsardo]